MRVIRFRQAVVSVRARAVARLLQTAQHADAQRIGVVAHFQRREQLRHFFALGKVSDFYAGVEHLFPQLGELFRLGRVVDAGNERQLRLMKFSRGDFVRQQHEFFDELVRFVVLDLLDALREAVGVDVDFDFGHVEVERAVAHAFFAKLRGDRPQRANVRAQLAELRVAEFGKRAPGVAGTVRGNGRQRADRAVVVFFHQRESLAVRQPLARGNDRVRELRRDDFSARVEHGENRFREPRFVFDERTDAAGKRVREHRNHGADEIRRVPAGARFGVERRSRAHVAGNVRDVHADARFPLGEMFDRKRVVEVLRVVRVDRDREDVPEVEPAAYLFFGYGRGNAAQLRGDGVGEFRRKTVAEENRAVFGERRVRDAENLLDLACGIFAAPRPFVEADDDFFSFLRLREQRRARGVGNENVLGDARVVRAHGPVIARADQRSRRRREGAFENFHDASAGQIVVVLRAVSPAEISASAFFFDADDDAVAVQRRSRVLGADAHGARRRRAVGGNVGQEFRASAHAEHQAAADEARVVGKAVAVALDLRDRSRARHARQRLFQFAEKFSVASERLAEFVGAQRRVVFAPHEFENFFFRVHDGGN